MVAIRLVGVGIAIVISGFCISCQSTAEESVILVPDRPLAVAKARSLKNPVPSTSESIAEGRTSYLRYACGTCHGDDGRALTDFAGPATDLTSPDVWTNGTSDGEIFRSIQDGVSSMPAFGSEIENSESIWHLVNYIHSLWPADAMVESEMP